MVGAAHVALSDDSTMRTHLPPMLAVAIWCMPGQRSFALLASRWFLRSWMVQLPPAAFNPLPNGPSYRAHPRLYRPRSS